MSATCQTCGGTGWVEAGWLGTPPDPSERERGCPSCDGTGIIVERQDEEDVPVDAERTLEREVVEAAVAQRLARLAYEEWLSHHTCATRAERTEQGRRWQPICEAMDRLRGAVDALLEYRREHDGNA